jgi:hypothetical protein
VSKTAHIAEGVYIYESTDTYGNGICCPYGAGEFNITLNGEPVAISSSGSGKKDFSWSDAVLASTLATGWVLRTLPVLCAGRYTTTCAGVAASRFKEATVFSYLSW